MKYLTYFLFSLFSGKKWEMGKRLLYKRWSNISLLLCVLMEKVTSLFYFALVSIDLFVFLSFLGLGQLIYNHCLSCSSLNLKISFLIWGWVNELEVAHRLCQERDMLIKLQRSIAIIWQPSQPSQPSNTGIKFTKAKWASPARKISTLPSAIPFNIVKWLQWP